MTPDDVAERLLDFAVRCGKVVDALPETRLGRHVAGQLVRFATSPAPNYEEARAAGSRADFVHKLQIGLKELRESGMWLRFIIRSKLLPNEKLKALVDEGDQLCRLLAKSVVTAKRPSKHPPVA